jgi:hypothetical protein
MQIARQRWYFVAALAAQPWRWRAGSLNFFESGVSTSIRKVHSAARYQRWPL